MGDDRKTVWFPDSYGLTSGFLDVKKTRINKFLFLYFVILEKRATYFYPASHLDHSRTTAATNNDFLDFYFRMLLIIECLPLTLTYTNHHLRPLYYICDTGAEGVCAKANATTQKDFPSQHH
jgi:hypothetical protein